MAIPNAIAEQLSQYGNVSRETLGILEAYVQLLEKWNTSINLVGKSTLQHVWQRHILDSAQLLAYLPKNKSCVITDLGSGAGFPGIVLAILSNHTLHLVESDKRKAAFLQQASLLVPGRVFIHNQRIEALSPWPSDVITSRALASLDQLLEYAMPFYKESSSCLFLKGVKLDEEVSLCKSKWEMEMELFPSITSESAAIVSLRNIRRKDN